jgi:Williams-Beuren syndrome DDT (WSD), D-TOX E motif
LHQETVNVSNYFDGVQLMLEAEEERRGGLQGHKAREREREAEFEKRVDGKAVRAEMMGWDRHQRSYWWMQCTAPVLWVFGPEAETMGFYHTTEQLNALFASLLESGVRERGLAQV